MSYFGTTLFRLTASENAVLNVEIAPVKELKVEKLLCGKTPEDAQELIPSLFALCPDSQLAACQLVCQAAADAQPDAELIARARFMNHLEIINEGVRYFALQCADADYRNAKVDTLQKIRKVIESIKAIPYSAKTEREQAWAGLRSLVSYMLLDGFSLDWEQDLYNGTIEAKPDSLSSFFAKITKTERSVGYCSAPLCRKNATFLLDALKAKGCWKRERWDVSLDALTGPIARMHVHPTIAGLLSSDGNTNYTRMTARFLEVLRAADIVRVPFETVSAMNLGPGLGVSLVENSRGVLLHTAEIRDGKIARYHILTPTEINVVNPPWVRKTLSQLRFKDAAELKAKAEFTILSFDPCTQFEVEVCHA